MIIGFAGCARAGKNTAIDIIAELYGKQFCYKLAFADKLKEDASDIILHYDGRFLDFTDEQIKIAKRGVLVHFGEMMRNYRSDYWISKMEDTIDSIKKRLKILVSICF